MLNKKRFLFLFIFGAIILAPSAVPQYVAASTTHIANTSNLSIELRHRRNEEVYLLQRVLASKNLLTESQLQGGEGFFGGQTETALKKFQQNLRYDETTLCVGMGLGYVQANGRLGACDRYLVNGYARSRGIVADFNTLPPASLVLSGVWERGVRPITPLQDGSYSLRTGAMFEILLTAENNNTLYPAFRYWQVSGAHDAETASTMSPAAGTSATLHVNSTALETSTYVAVPPASDPIRTVVFELYDADRHSLVPPVYFAVKLVREGAGAVPTVTANPAWVQLPANGEPARTNLTWTNTGTPASCRVVGINPQGGVILSTTAATLANGASGNSSLVSLSQVGTYSFNVTCNNLHNTGQVSNTTQVQVAPSATGGDVGGDDEDSVGEEGDENDNRLTATVTASASAANYPATNAGDGNESTWWIANKSVDDANNNAWIKLDFGAPRLITAVKWKGIAWDPGSYPAASPSVYAIQVSADNSTWTTIYSTPPSMVNYVTPVHLGEYTWTASNVPLAATNARYVRLSTTRVNDGSGWSLGLKEFWAEGSTAVGESSSAQFPSFSLNATNQDNGQNRGAIVTISSASSLNGNGLVVLRASNVAGLPITPPSTLPNFCTTSTGLCRAYHLGSISGNQTSTQFFNSSLPANTDYAYGAWLYTGSGNSINYSARVTDTVHTTGSNAAITIAKAGGVQIAAGSVTAPATAFEDYQFTANTERIEIDFSYSDMPEPRRLYFTRDGQSVGFATSLNGSGAAKYKISLSPKMAEGASATIVATVKTSSGGAVTPEISQTFTVTKAAAPAANPGVLATPVVSAELNGTTLTLSWPHVGGASKYDIRYNGAANNLIAVGDIGSTVTPAWHQLSLHYDDYGTGSIRSKTFTNLVPGKRYVFHVFAISNNADVSNSGNRQVVVEVPATGTTQPSVSISMPAGKTQWTYDELAISSGERYLPVQVTAANLGTDLKLFGITVNGFSETVLPAVADQAVSETTSATHNVTAKVRIAKGSGRLPANGVGTLTLRAKFVKNGVTFVESAPLTVNFVAAGNPPAKPVTFSGEPIVYVAQEGPIWMQCKTDSLNDSGNIEVFSTDASGAQLPSPAKTSVSWRSGNTYAFYLFGKSYSSNISSDPNYYGVARNFSCRDKNNASTVRTVTRVCNAGAGTNTIRPQTTCAAGQLGGTSASPSFTIAKAGGVQIAAGSVTAPATAFEDYQFTANTERIEIDFSYSDMPEPRRLYFTRDGQSVGFATSLNGSGAAKYKISLSPKMAEGASATIVATVKTSSGGTVTPEIVQTFTVTKGATVPAAPPSPTLTLAPTGGPGTGNTGATVTVQATSGESLSGKGVLVLRAGTVSALPQNPPAPTSIPSSCQGSTTELCSVTNNTVELSEYTVSQTALSSDTTYHYAAWIFTEGGSSRVYSMRAANSVITRSATNSADGDNACSASGVLLQGFETTSAGANARETQAGLVKCGSGSGKLVYPIKTSSWDNRYIGLGTANWSAYRYLEFWMYADSNNPDSTVPQLKMTGVYSGNTSGAFNGTSGIFENRSYAPGLVKGQWKKVSIDLAEYTSRSDVSSINFYFYYPWSSNGAHAYYIDDIRLTNTQTASSASSGGSQFASIAAILESMRGVLRGLFQSL